MAIHLRKTRSARKVRGVSEKSIQTAILQFLALHRIMAWRVNSGALPVGEGENRRFLRFNTQAGCSDIIGVLPGGRFLAIEVKSATGRLRDSQELFLGEVTRNGGLAFVARSVEDVQRVLRANGYEC